MKKSAHAAFAALLLLAACSEPPGQNRYDARDVGQSSQVLFGTILTERHVQIASENTGLGAVAGGAGGGVAGALIGAGKGSVIGALAGVVIGGVLGNEAEKGLGNRPGIEYVIAMDNGTTQSIVQNASPDDRPIFVGQRVMVQVNGYYHRVLPADSTLAPAPAAPAPAAPPATGAGR